MKQIMTPIISNDSVDALIYQALRHSETRRTPIQVITWSSICRMGGIISGMSNVKFPNIRKSVKAGSVSAYGLPYNQRYGSSRGWSNSGIAEASVVSHQYRDGPSPL